MTTPDPIDPAGLSARRERTHAAEAGWEEGASTWRAILAACVLFLVSGLFLIFQELPLSWPLPEWLLPIQATILLGLIVLPALGFGIGWMQGFPRWSYPYVGNLLLFGLYMMSVATPGLRLFGYTFGRQDLWGWRAWLPALGMLGLALLVTRSLRPLERFVARFWRDATLWPWMWFGFLPFLAGIAFDEMDRGFSLPFMALITLVAVGTAMLYLRSPHAWLRGLALVTGASVLVAIGVDVVGSVKVGAVLLALLFVPAAISLLHRARSA